MLGLLTSLLHFVCLMFFLRILFRISSELFFHPLLRWIGNFTDPVLFFLKNNRILNNIIHPLIPLLAILLLKSILFESAIGHKASLQAFLLSIIQFNSFLFKFYLISFYLSFASARYHIYDDIFNLLNTIFVRTFAAVAPKQKVSVKNDPFKAFGFLNLLFFIVFMASFALFVFSISRTGHLTIETLLIAPLKYLLLIINSLIQLLPLLLFIRIILSWFTPPVTKPLLILHALTEPVLEPCRRLLTIILKELGISTGFFDFSPILAFFAISFISSFFIKMLTLLPHTFIDSLS